MGIQYWSHSEFNKNVIMVQYKIFHRDFFENMQL